MLFLVTNFLLADAPANKTGNLWVYAIVIGLVIWLMRLFRNSPGDIKRSRETWSEMFARFDNENRIRNAPHAEWARKRRIEEEECARKRKIEEEPWARQKWIIFHQSMSLANIDNMSGIQFEQFLKLLFERLGYANVQSTPVTGDQGADLHCNSPDGTRVVVQAKRWKGTVGNSAIQEVLGALLFYDCEIGFVVTNSSFTESARRLAERDNRIRLIDRKELARLAGLVFPVQIPDFNWTEFERSVREW